ncbi:MAG TPA: hypothetical protein VG675_19220 [Bryobacteraceae bacterium]|nr:hypothetical protein [Bryobacteraceae bacterium]
MQPNPSVPISAQRSAPARLTLLWPILLTALLLALLPARSIAAVSLVVDSQLGPPAEHGLTALQAALDSKKIQSEVRKSLSSSAAGPLIVIGRATGSAAVRQIQQSAGLQMPTGAEALLVRNLKWNGKDVLLLCGSDDTGLMYALLDVADQIRLAAPGRDPLASIANASERPHLKERSVTKMIMNRSEAERYLYSDQYWTDYLDMLARDRYNAFVFMFGYGSAGYFDPPYPFLFSLPEFPEVRVAGMTPAEQQRNLDMLRKIMRMAHDRGIHFTLAIWTHIHRGKQGPGLPTGLTDANLLPYSKAALGKLIESLPDLDALQFRAHVESSLTLPEQVPFWKMVLSTVKESGRPIRVDMRVKGFSDDLIDLTLNSGVKNRLVTKFWGEELGLPFHPTEDDLANKFKRRHSYADLLSYPRRYDMMFTLWSHGTVKILLWGDPDYARRFTESCLLYDGPGFDMFEPLAFKMGYKLGLHQQPSFDILSKDYQYYKWEFQRYWYYYQLFGRIGYDPKTPPRVWGAEFQNRFGAGAAPFVEAAYTDGSRVLPRIVAYATRDMSAGSSWPEKQRWEDLPEYVNVRPADTAQFLGIEEAARFRLEGRTSPKIWPEQNSRWFANISEATLRNVSEAERLIGPHPSNEFRSTMIDMKVLAYLGAYHSRRLLAGMDYALYEKTHDLSTFDSAIAHEKEAIAEWAKIIPITTGVYPKNIIMGRGPRMAGNWSDELTALRADLAKLENARAHAEPQYRETVARLQFTDGQPEAGFSPVTSRRFYSLSQGGYGWYDASLTRASAKAGYLGGPPPDGYGESSFGIDLPNGNYEVTFTMADHSATPKDHGPMWIETQGIGITDHFRVPAGQTVQKKLPAKVVDGRLNVIFNSSVDGDWIIDSMVVDRVGPVIGHVPVRRAAPGSDIEIRATVNGPDPIDTVYLTYGNDKTGYTRKPMATSTEASIYHATIPGAQVVAGLNYFLEAVDRTGRRVTYPHDGADAPVRVAVTTDNSAPTVVHRAITTAKPNEPIVITAQVTDASGVDSVYVRYRGVNQHQDFHSLRMLPTGRPGEYRAEIPGSDVDPRWDLMYYLEATDHFGTGRIYPNLDKETPYIVVKLQR